MIPSFAPTAHAQLPSGPATVSITVDNGRPHQRIEGFGATTVSLVYGPVDNMTAAQRAAAVEAAYNQVRLTMGNLEPGLMETPAAATDLWNQRRNDNDDPFAINPAGFNWLGADAMKGRIVDLAAPYGFDNFSLADKLTTSGAVNFIDQYRTTDYSRYLDECAEHIIAGLLHWRDSYGIVPRWVMPWNEPTSGNHEIVGGTTQILVDLVKRIGRRMQDSGFNATKLVVPGEETVQRSYDVARAILADPEARRFVGAIAYHGYPYGSAYASPRSILNTSGRGSPAGAEIEIRNKIRNLGAEYGIPVWMTEISEGPGNANYPFDAFENLLARAIHIHDEFLYADAAAYYGMNAIWDRRSHEQHFAGRGVDFFTETTSIVLADTDRVHISGMGYAIGHYARWIKRGARRIDASSDDRLVQVTALRDDIQRRLVLVLINNGTEVRTVSVNLAGIGVTGAIVGEQSYGTQRWKQLPGSVPLDSTHLSLTVPASSVTTISVPLTTASSAVPGAPMPLGVRVHGVRPNPMRGHGEMDITLDVAAHVRLTLNDEAGRELRTLANRMMEVGSHALSFDLRGIASGAYLLALDARGRRWVERVVVVR